MTPFEMRCMYMGLLRWHFKIRLVDQEPFVFDCHDNIGWSIESNIAFVPPDVRTMLEGLKYGGAEVIG